MINWISSRIKPSKKGIYLIKIFDKYSGRTSYTDALFDPKRTSDPILDANKSPRNIGWSYCNCHKNGDVIGWYEL